MAPTFSPEPGAARVDVPLGRRVMVVSDLLLTPDATPSSLAVTSQLARALDTWDGPGILIIAGNLFDLSGCASPLEEARRSLDAHPALARALTRFLTVDERRVIRQTGTHEPGYDTDPEAIAAVAHGGWSSSARSTSISGPPPGSGWCGWSPASTPTPPGAGAPETEFDPAADAKPGAIGPSPAGRGWRSLAAQSEEDAPWLAGLNRLSDPSALSRFVVSRTLYRRLGRYAWWLLVPFAVAGLLRVAVTPWVSGHLGTGLPGRAIRHAHQADFGDQVVIAATVSPGRAGRAGPGARPAEPPDVVHPRRRCPRDRAGRGRSQRRRPRRRPPPARAGVRRPDHRGHLPVGAHPSGPGLLRQRRRHRRGGGGAPGTAGPAAGLPAEPAGQLGRAGDRGRAPRPDAAGPQRAPVAQRARAAGHPGARRAQPPPLAGGLVPDGRVVAAGARPPPGPPADPPGAAVGLGRHPLRRPGRPARRHHPSPAGPSPRGAGVPPAPGQRGGRGADRHGRTGPRGAGPGDPPRPAAGLAGGRGPPGRHHPPPPHRRRRRRGVALRPRPS